MLKKNRVKNGFCHQKIDLEIEAKRTHGGPKCVQKWGHRKNSSKSILFASNRLIENFSDIYNYVPVEFLQNLEKSMFC